MQLSCLHHCFDIAFLLCLTCMELFVILCFYISVFTSASTKLRGRISFYYSQSWPYISNFFALSLYVFLSTDHRNSFISGIIIWFSSNGFCFVEDYLRRQQFTSYKHVYVCGTKPVTIRNICIYIFCAALLSY